MQMTGTEKQIAWATDIREDFVSLMGSAEIVRAWLRLSDNGLKAGQSEVGLAALDNALAEADAKWWIDNRSDLMSATLLRIVQAMVFAASGQTPPADKLANSVSAMHGKIKARECEIMSSQPQRRLGHA